MIYKKEKRETHQFSRFLIKNLIFKSKTAIEKILEDTSASNRTSLF